MVIKLILLVLALPALGSQARLPRRPDPQAQLQEYYRQYPDRYIRVSKQKWNYEEKSRTAIHSFTLTNTANATYFDMQVRFTYQTSKGKTLHTETLPIKGALAPFKTMDINAMRVKKVPPAAETVLIVVDKATVYR